MHSHTMLYTMRLSSLLTVRQRLRSANSLDRLFTIKHILTYPKIYKPIYKSLEMLEIFNQIKGNGTPDGVVKIKGLSFFLNGKVTVVILLLFALIITSRQFIGSPINCLGNEQIQKLADDFCWSNYTFTKHAQDDGPFRGKQNKYLDIIQFI